MIQFQKVGKKIKESEKFKLAFKNLKDGHYTIEETKNVRSLKQNSYYRVILGHIAKETGELNVKYLHYTMKAMFMIQTTANLDTALFTDYVDFVKHRAYHFLGITLPEPV